MKKKHGKICAVRSRTSRTRTEYEALEPRQVLASLFPTYIDGQFTFGNGPESATPYDLADTFRLESNPDATKTIYLDFDGHHSVNNQWGHDIVFPAFNRGGSAGSFSNAELLEIQLQFQNVAEDFLPFDVNVTTKEPSLEKLIRSDVSDEYYGVRSVNTQATAGFGNGIGGVAYLNSFDNSRDDPVFVFNKGSNNGAMTNSHEIGHSLGLSHDGLGSSTYHPGVGSGETSWGPIMGAPFGENVTQWSNGDYANSTQAQNDFSIITKPANGFGFRTDLIGDTIGTATELIPATDNSVFQWNIIERNDDIDMYMFQTGGAVSLSINAFQERPNLDVLAKIVDASGNVVAQSNPANGVDAGFDLTLQPGRYYLSVEGTGKSGVYSDYGSVGFFTVSGTIEAFDGGDAVDVIVGETGRLSIDQNWRTVTLNHVYLDPVVIAGPATIRGGEPLTVRIRNVTGSSFEIHLDEWDYLNKKHAFETVDYLVVEAGEHSLSDGTVLVAGNQAGQTELWSDYSLGNAFAEGDRPVVLSQIVTENDPAAATTRMQFTSDTEFRIKIREQDANQQNHAAETVSFVAIQAGVGNTGDSSFQALVTPDSVTHENFSLRFGTKFESTPAFFADLQTHDGGDTATVRYRALDTGGATFFVEEEQSKDAETRHTAEVVGILAIEFGDIVAQGAGAAGFLDSANVVTGDAAPVFLGNSIRSSSAHDSELWRAVRIQRSWGETAFSIHGHDMEFDDHNVVWSRNFAGFQNHVDLVGFKFRHETKIDADLKRVTAQFDLDGRSVERKLVGAIESQRVAETHTHAGEKQIHSSLDSQPARRGKFQSIDRVFEIEFDWLG